MKAASVLVGVIHVALAAFAYAGDVESVLAGVSTEGKGETPMTSIPGGFQGDQNGKPTTQIPGGFQGNQGNIPTKPTPTSTPALTTPAPTTPAPTTPSPTTPSPTTPAPATEVTNLCTTQVFQAAIANNKPLLACATDAQYAFFSAVEPPTKAQMDVMCASTNCKDAVQNALKDAPADCILPMNRLLLRSEIFDRIDKYCKTGEVIAPAPKPTLPSVPNAPLPTPAPVPAPVPAPAYPSPFCTSEQIDPVTKATTDLIQCSKDSGFVFVPLTRPTPDVVTKMCASTSCVKVFTATLGATPTECTVPLGGTQYVADVLNVVGSACKLSATTPAPTGTTPAPTGSTPAPTGTTPAPTTAKPSTPGAVCDAKLLSTLLYTNKDFVSCATSTQFPLASFSVAPTKEQMDQFCASQTCSNAFAAALATNPTECMIPLGQFSLRADFLERVTNYCKTGVVPPTTTPTTPAPVPLPTPAPVPAPVPGPAKPSPFCTSQQIAPITKVTADLTQCSKDAGFAFVPLTKPTSDVVTKMCASTSCVKVITAALEANPTECTVPLGGVQYLADFLNVIGSACKLSPSTPAPSGTTPAPTTTKPSTGAVCDAKLLSTLLYTNKDFVACATSTQFPLAGFSVPPSKEQMDQFCASQTCSNAFAAALATNPTECTIPFGQLSLRADFLERVMNYCNTGVVPPTTTPPTPAPVPLPTPAPVPAPGPAPVTPSPFCTSQQLVPVTQVTGDLTQCSKDAGFAFVPLTKPSSDVVTKMCASASCVKVFTTAVAANPTECTVPLGGIQYVADFLNVVGTACKLSPTTPAPTGTTPAPTTTKPSTPGAVCDAKLLSKLLYTNADFVSCATSTQFPLGGFSVPPSKEQMDKFCASETCSKAFAAALATNPTECTIPLGQLSLRADFLDRVVNYCKTGIVPPTTTPPTPAPVPLPTPAPVPAPGPAPVTPSPYCTSEQVTPVTKVTADLVQCSKDSGYSFVPLIKPSTDVVAKICASVSCVKVFSGALGANPKECTVPLGGVQYVADVLSVLGSACKLSPTTPVPTTLAPTTPEPTKPVPTTPSPTTAEPTKPVPTTPVPTTAEPTKPVPTTPTSTTAEPTKPVPTTPTPTTPVPTTPTPTTPAPTKPGPIAGGPCGNLNDGPSKCPEGQYCQPWNPYYYQCRSIDATCGVQQVDVDFYGEDLTSLSVMLPDDCCAKCRATDGCHAYTYVNYNTDGKPMCYLKKGTGKQQKLPGAVSAIVQAPTCAVASGGQCGSDKDGVKCCPSGEYCQPWNPMYYQCRPAPAKCGVQEIGVDYNGDDLQTIYGILPWECCDKCSETAGCKAYTFVNYNPDGRSACYLKKGTGTKQTKTGAVSSVVLNPKSACTTPEYGTCGSASGTTCCPSGFYCQAWNPMYYQCMPNPTQCSQQYTDVDFYGNDLETVYGISPSDCCAKCSTTKGCKAYTFVNVNPGRPACYLKSSASGHKTLSAAVSGVLN